MSILHMALLSIIMTVAHVVFWAPDMVVVERLELLDQAQVTTCLRAMAPAVWTIMAQSLKESPKGCCFAYFGFLGRRAKYKIFGVSASKFLERNQTPQISDTRTLWGLWFAHAGDQITSSWVCMLPPKIPKIMRGWTSNLFYCCGLRASTRACRSARICSTTSPLQQHPGYIAFHGAQKLVFATCGHVMKVADRSSLPWFGPYRGFQNTGAFFRSFLNKDHSIEGLFWDPPFLETPIDSLIHRPGCHKGAPNCNVFLLINSFGRQGLLTASTTPWCIFL